MPSRRRVRFSALFAMVLVLAPAAVHSLRGDEFTNALRRFLSEDPETRLDGERRLRRLGELAMKRLGEWVDLKRAQVARARVLLDELRGRSGEDPEIEDILRDYFARKLEAGWGMLLDGDYAEAQRIAQALETLDGDSARVYDYRRLWRASRERLIRNEVLEPAVEFRERVYEMGVTPTVLFRLRNRQARQLVINAAQGVLGTLEVTVKRSFMSGSETRSVKKVPIRTFEDARRIVIPAGRSYERDVPIDLGDDFAHSGMVASVSVVGKFRPYQWGAGRFNVNETLELPETECWFVPDGMKRLAEYPVRHVEVALLLRDTTRFFAAGQFAVWAAAGDEELTDRLLRLLVASLDDLSDVGFQIADRFLKQAGEVAKGTRSDRQYWKDWIAERKRPRRPERRGKVFVPPPPLLNDGKR